VDIFGGGDTRPVPDEVRQQLLEPFLWAAQVTLAEMAGVEVVVRSAYRTGEHRLLGDLAAVLPVTSPTVAALVLHFPRQTATALAGRVLAGVVAEPDEGLIRDCLGEVANVVAGQAKALLLGTPHHFTLSTPTVASAAQPVALGNPNGEHLVAVLGGAVGDFALEVCLNR
jgi:chemotaxis protein CheX